MERINLKRVVIAYPSGNTTAILFDRPANCNPKYLNDQIMLAWKTLRLEKPEVEQCCIVSKPQDNSAIARIEMLGGEFCGNATRGALWVLSDGKPCVGRVEVSGVDRSLDFSISGDKVTLEMPLSQGSKTIQAVDDGWLVQFDGIIQLVRTSPSSQTLRQLLAELVSNNRYNIATQPAVGISQYDALTQKATFCVWVQAIDTVFDETACGSGTCAIGIAQAYATGQSTMLDVIQPSGEIIQTEATYESSIITGAYITGGLKVLYDGPLELS